MKPADHADRLARARLSLLGLSVGDAFGEQFFRSPEEALWRTVSGLGDRDTTCAIVGGILALGVGEKGTTGAWVRAREKLPT